MGFYFIFSSFKLFLELEPQLRDVLYKFHESQYAACLKLLDELKVHTNCVDCYKSRRKVLSFNNPSAANEKKKKQGI